MQFEITDLKAIGEALEGIVEKMQEQFAPVAFDITLEYGNGDPGDTLVVKLTSIENQPWRFLVDITEKPEPVVTT